MRSDVPKDEGLLEAAGEDREVLLSRLLEQHRERLLRMVRLRMHPQVRTRVDASDVIQEAYIEAVRRVGEYVEDPQVPFFVWLRRMTGQRLMKAHRFHLDAQRRDVRRQVRGASDDVPEASVVAMVELLAGDGTTPTRAAARSELRERIRDLLGELSPTDREVLCMRHFEDLSNEEVAHELDLSKHAASKRYIRALRRLRELVGDDATS